MKKIIYTLLLLVPLGSFAAGDKVHLQSADINLSDFKAIQKGAKHYVTYCLGCHSAKHMRYKRIAIDLEIDEDTVLAEIAPEGARIYDQMHTAMNEHDSKKWFGVMPPDLSLIARSRGADWLYSYLKGFYVDKSKPFGVNNTVFKDVGMPNMLWKLQGIQSPVIRNVKGEEVISYLELKESGSMSRSQFDTMVTELVNFLVYVGEPVQLERKRMGKYVLFYFLLFGIVAYLLKKEYWKDIH
ncbi:MAG: cytochrome c1 [Methylococcales bacterium]|nr:cytochrome c1 [Methylococcales bacterium]MCK5904698.1 cytochrome c1 [Gammaproteobacteria bacterium]